MKILSTRQKDLAYLSVITASLIFAKQDIWISELLQNIDPLLFSFWIFLIVSLFAVIIGFCKSESLKIPIESIKDIFGLNITTLVSWIFTFLALSKASPAVVAAGTLSAPLVISLMVFENKKKLSKSNILILLIILLGLIIGAFQNSDVIKIDVPSILYCLLASIGVVGNSYFMKRLNKFEIKANTVLSLRFLLMLFALGIYFFAKFGSVPFIPLPISTTITIALLTSYIPLAILYFSHIHLEIFVINLFLALTPVFSLALIGLSPKKTEISTAHYFSVLLILVGVMFGYLKEKFHEKK